MRRSELLTLVIVLAVLVIFILYLKRLQQVRARREARFLEDEDTSCPATCTTDEIPCLTNWFHTFDSTYRTNTTTSTAIFQAVATQPDGKTIVASNFESGNPMFIERFNTDGTVDGTFTQPTLPGIWPPGQWKMIRVANDGSIFVVGFGDATNSSAQSAILLKLTPSGPLDTSFGTGGFWYDDLNGHDASEGYCLHLLPNGKILVGGVVRDSSPNAGSVCRINADGTLDTTFGTGGFFWLAAPISDYGETWGLGVQDDGKIVAGGYFADGSGNIYGLGAMRLSANGVLDTTYNGIGFNTQNFDDIDGAGTCAVLLDGEMYVGGWVYVTGLNQNMQAIAKYTSIGLLDVTWGNNAGFFIDEPDPALILINKYSQVNGICAVCDGGLFVVGHTNPVLNPNRKGFIYKLDSTGNLDTNFGDGNGYALTAGLSDYRQVFQHQVTTLFIAGMVSASDTAVSKVTLTAF